MLERLQRLVKETSPKSLGNRLKKDKELLNWLSNTTCHLSPLLSLTERAFLIINGIESNCCSITNKPKRFISITKGYGFCGRAKECQCMCESVSKKIADSHKYLSDEEKNAINQKRANTNLLKYGVTNSGQTPLAKLAHQNFYSNQENVNNQLDKQKATVLTKYGVTNVAHLDEVRQKRKITNLEKYGVENPMQLQQVADKAKMTKLEQYSPHSLAKKNHKRFIQMIRENFNLNALVTEEQYIGVQTRPVILFECISCGNTFNKRFDYASLPKCKICYPTDTNYKSKEELDLLNFVNTQVPGNVISGDRSVIYPYEIDIYLPNLNIGIEYCGLYWHSERGGKKSWNYHYRKWALARKAGIELITVFSDEWLYQRTIVENIIRSKLGTGLRNIGARKCKVVTPSRQSSIDFYDSYHLLGSPTKLPINVGLEYKDELVALMSFVRNSDHSYELIRFASKNHIPGGASRLLSSFVNTYHPSSIVSFSDNRYSQGDLYQKLGFVQVGVVPPMQQYVENYTTKYHKLSLNKAKLKKLHPYIDLEKTEWQILQELGYDRIWDCGKIKWELQLTTTK
jgi:hypothetical protein